MKDQNVIIDKTIFSNKLSHNILFYESTKYGLMLH